MADHIQLAEEIVFQAFQIPLGYISQLKEK